MFRSAPPKGGASSDAVDALVVALDLIIKRTKEQWPHGHMVS